MRRSRAGRPTTRPQVRPSRLLSLPRPRPPRLRHVQRPSGLPCLQHQLQLRLLLLFLFLGDESLHSSSFVLLMPDSDSEVPSADATQFRVFRCHPGGADAIEFRLCSIQPVALALTAEFGCASGVTSLALNRTLWMVQTARVTAHGRSFLPSLSVGYQTTQWGSQLTLEVDNEAVMGWQKSWVVHAGCCQICVYVCV